MIINNYIDKRVYFEKKHLIEKSREKPLFYTLDVLFHTKKDGEKLYIKKIDFDRISKKYKNKTNFFLKTKWFFQTMYRNILIWWKFRKFKTTKEISDHRINICKKCPEYKSNGTCGICGCIMSIKTKLIAAECPNKPPRWI